MVNIRKKIIKIKVTCDAKSVKLTTRKKVEVTSLKIKYFAQSREVTTNFHFFDKPIGTGYDLILGGDFQKFVVLNILNGNLAIRWHEVQVIMVGMVYYNYIVINDYQWKISIVEP